MFQNICDYLLIQEKKRFGMVDIDNIRKILFHDNYSVQIDRSGMLYAKKVDNGIQLPSNGQTKDISLGKTDIKYINTESSMFLYDDKLYLVKYNWIENKFIYSSGNDDDNKELIIIKVKGLGSLEYKILNFWPYLSKKYHFFMMKWEEYNEFVVIDVSKYIHETGLYKPVSGKEEEEEGESFELVEHYTDVIYLESNKVILYSKIGSTYTLLELSKNTSGDESELIFDHIGPSDFFDVSTGPNYYINPDFTRTPEPFEPSWLQSSSFIASDKGDSFWATMCSDDSINHIYRINIFDNVALRSWNSDFLYIPPGYKNILFLTRVLGCRNFSVYGILCSKTKRKRSGIKFPYLFCLWNRKGHLIQSFGILKIPVGIMSFPSHTLLSFYDHSMFILNRF